MESLSTTGSPGGRGLPTPERRSTPCHRVPVAGGATGGLRRCPV